jgi:hypothetical protein
MLHSGTRADARDDRADGRDDTADHRDDLARDRDSAAQQRDTDAEQRLAAAQTQADDLADRLHRTSLQILDRLARIEHTTPDHTDWPDLPPAALARLDALLAEQRTLARLDRQAVHALLDDLHDAVQELRRGHRADSRERGAAGRDRHHSLGDRTDSGRDRRDARADRHQSAIDREQVHPRDLLPPPAGADPAEVLLRTEDQAARRHARAIAGSRQHIAETRSYLSGIGRDQAVPSAPDGAPAPPDPDA